MPTTKPTRVSPTTRRWTSSTLTRNSRLTGCSDRERRNGRSRRWELAMALLSDEEIGAKLGELNGWARKGEAITKDFSCGDFVGSVKFVDDLVGPAEEMGHHPDLEISWDTV